MVTLLQGVLALVGRIMLATIFILSAVGNKIPSFNSVAEAMQAEGVPAPKVLLAGAIVFLLAGGASLIVGYRARWGAFLLLVFLILATYFFHDFWTVDDAEARGQQMIQFMKNVALMGAMILVIANGPGPLSLDSIRARLTPATE